MSRLGNEIMRRIGQEQQNVNPRVGREDFEMWLSEGDYIRYWLEAVIASSEGTLDCRSPKEKQLGA